VGAPDDARDSDSPDEDESQDSSVPAADDRKDAAAGAVNLNKQDDKKKQDGKDKPAKKKSARDPDRKGIFARFGLFLRQVMAELRKVIWPTRSELINYTAVVLVFVVIMALILAAYDFAFARAVFFVFDS
jgi:preprotein translocase subunit SecE